MMELFLSGSTSTATSLETVLESLMKIFTWGMELITSQTIFTIAFFGTIVIGIVTLMLRKTKSASK